MEFENFRKCHFKDFSLDLGYNSVYICTKNFRRFDSEGLLIDIVPHKPYQSLTNDEFPIDREVYNIKGEFKSLSGDFLYHKSYKILQVKSDGQTGILKVPSEIEFTVLVFDNMIYPTDEYKEYKKKAYYSSKLGGRI